MRVSFFGDSIRKQTSMTVILPQDTKVEGPYPVLYLLHGMSDDDTIWERRTSLERYVAEMPLIVVMPDGGRGFYTDAVQGYAYESHIMKDVMGFTERFFPAMRERKGRCIGGLSMGGYGSMKLALKYPDMFCSVVSHSSAFSVRRRVENKERSKESILVFGEHPENTDNDPWYLAKTIDRAKLPAIRFDCGTEDFLIEENREFHKYMGELGIPHEYDEFPGTHNWAFWDEHVQQALKFHAKALGI
jgi:S-formylglutathione hydrolase FrmB